MNSVAYSPAAIGDLSDIWDYTADNWGLDQADKYTDNIRDTCIDLAMGKRQGREVYVRDGYRKYPVGRHLVFFVETEDGIAVVRILHQRMDVERHI